MTDKQYHNKTVTTCSASTRRRTTSAAGASVRSAFVLRTDLDGGRSWIFCCTDQQSWSEALKTKGRMPTCAITHGGGLAGALQS